MCQIIQEDLHEMTDIAKEIRGLVEPYTYASPAASQHNGNGIDQQFLRSSDDTDAFAAPSYSSDHR